MSTERNSHAHRTPESVSSHQTTKTTENQRDKNASGYYNNVNTQNTANNVSGNTFHRGDASYSRGMTSRKHVTSLTPAEEKKIQKRKESEINRLKSEKEWQNEVVRVHGRVDMTLLVVILLLLVVGAITVYSASYPLALSEGREATYYIKRQLIFIAIGIMIMLLEIFVVPIELFKNKYIVFGAYIFSVGLLILTMFQGNAEGEAVRWIRIGPVNVQPSELMKFSLILMLAWYADKYERRIKEINLGGTSYLYNTFIPFVIIGGACIFVLLGKHLSGFLIILVIGVAAMIVVGSKLKWMVATTPPFIIAGVIYLLKHQYALKRILSFFDPDADVTDEMYQTTQSIYAIGSGGFWGVGLGNSRQKYNYLTQAHTDFIFSIWCEEFGFAGAVALIAAFVVFIWRGYTIAAKAPDRFTMVTAFGITTHVGIQAFLNMFVASKIIMNTGVTLPFFSYGGSSMVILLAEMGLLLSISRQYYKKKSEIEREQMMKNLGL